MIDVAIVVMVSIVLGIMLLLLRRLQRVEMQLNTVESRDESVTTVNATVEQSPDKTHDSGPSLFPVPINPLSDLEYKEALAISPLFEKAVEVSQIRVLQSAEQLKQMDGVPVEIQNALAPLTQTVRLVDSIQDVGKSGRIVFELSKEGQQAVKKGLAEIMKTKDGKSYLPITKDGAKKFKELFKGKDPSDLLKVTKLTNAVVNAANIISGADQAKKLKVINKKVDELLRRHDAELASRLEANYYLVKDILSSGEEVSQRAMLFGVRKELFELRANWRRIISARIESVEDPKDNFFKRLLTTQKSRDRTVVDGLSFENEIHLIEFSIALTLLIDSVLGLESDGLTYETEQFHDIRKEWEKKVKLLTAGSEERKLMNSQLRGYTKFVELIEQYQSAQVMIDQK